MAMRGTAAATASAAADAELRHPMAQRRLGDLQLDSGRQRGNVRLLTSLRLRSCSSEARGAGSDGDGIDDEVRAAGPEEEDEGDPAIRCGAPELALRCCSRSRTSRQT